MHALLTIVLKLCLVPSLSLFFKLPGRWRKWYHWLLSYALLQIIATQFSAEACARRLLFFIHRNVEVLADLVYRVVKVFGILFVICYAFSCSRVTTLVFSLELRKWRICRREWLLKLLWYLVHISMFTIDRIWYLK